MRFTWRFKKRACQTRGLAGSFCYRSGGGSKAIAVPPPKPQIVKGIYHPKAASPFTSLAEYLAWYRSRRLVPADAARLIGPHRAARLEAGQRHLGDAGDMAAAHALNERLFPLHQALFTDASPGPVKYALSRVLGWIDDSVRLPLVPCSAASRAAVDAALEHAGLV